MKNSLLYLIVLVLVFFIFSASSCHKEDTVPYLVPITTTGANTMGFYIDGVAYNKKGSIKAGESSVSWGKYADGKIKIFGGGGGSLWFNKD